MKRAVLLASAACAVAMLLPSAASAHGLAGAALLTSSLKSTDADIKHEFTFQPMTRGHVVRSIVIQFCQYSLPTIPCHNVDTTVKTKVSDTHKATLESISGLVHPTPPNDPPDTGSGWYIGSWAGNAVRLHTMQEGFPVTDGRVTIKLSGIDRVSSPAGQRFVRVSLYEDASYAKLVDEDVLPYTVAGSASRWVDAAAAPGGDGSEALPFKTISDAVAAAPTATDSEILVRNGTYQEDNVPGADVQLRLPSTTSGRRLVIQGYGSSRPQLTTPLNFSSSERVTVSGLQLGIAYIGTSSEATLRQSEITGGNEWACIGYGGGSSRSVIAGNWIHHCRKGVSGTVNAIGNEDEAITLRDNLIEDLTDDGIQIANVHPYVPSAGSPVRSAIDGNMTRRSCDHGDIHNDGLQFLGNVHAIDVTSNVIYNIEQQGMFLDTGGASNPTFQVMNDDVSVVNNLVFKAPWTGTAPANCTPALNNASLVIGWTTRFRGMHNTIWNDVSVVPPYNKGTVSFNPAIGTDSVFFNNLVSAQGIGQGGGLPQNDYNYVGVFASKGQQNSAEHPHDRVWCRWNSSGVLQEPPNCSGPPPSFAREVEVLFAPPVPVDGDFYPCPASGAIDGGTTSFGVSPAPLVDSPLADVNGMPRVGAPDMGAFEHTPSLTGGSHC